MTSDGSRRKQFKRAANASEISPGTAAAVELEGQWFAICNDAGIFYATDILCPHAEGSLAGGEVCDGCVVCPVHHWPWDLKTGLTAPEMPHLRLARYACEVRNGEVFIDTSAPLPPVLEPDAQDMD
jgi:nitrite reductase/ring-hydroxylating ferredoxin subunit